MECSCTANGLLESSLHKQQGCTMCSSVLNWETHADMF